MPEIADVRSYHLRHSRTRASGVAGLVTSPRHLVFYRLSYDPPEILVARVLHDAMDAQRHIPE
jgi:toxin ParE1/3/4